jgi:hypothetical protein
MRHTGFLNRDVAELYNNVRRLTDTVAVQEVLIAKLIGDLAGVDARLTRHQERHLLDDALAATPISGASS